MSTQRPDMVFDLEKFISAATSSFTNAAAELRETFETDEWKDSPYIYHMPKMSLNVNVSLSYSNGKVKGFFSKSNSSEEQTLASAISIDVVSVPRMAGPTKTSKEPAASGDRSGPPRRTEGGTTSDPIEPGPSPTNDETEEEWPSD
jgi:hypothetical protein